MRWIAEALGADFVIPAICACHLEDLKIADRTLEVVDGSQVSQGNLIWHIAVATYKGSFFLSITAALGTDTALEIHCPIAVATL